MIHLALSSNENYADGMLVTVASALSSLHPETQIMVHLLDGGISNKTTTKLSKICKSLHKLCILNIAKIQEQSFNGFTLGPGNSLMPYARLLIGSLLSKIDKVIYIDVDFLVLKNLEDLWKRDMEGKIAWVCKDITIPCLEGETPLPVSVDEGKFTYFNSGLMLLDLKKWRKSEIEEKALSLGSVNRSGLADQSILNYLLRRDIGFLEDDWNWQSPNVLLNGKVRLANYHFVWVKKPWMHLRTTLNYRLWRYYYKKYAMGGVLSLYWRIGIKRLVIGIREMLIRSFPFIHSFYIKLLAKKLGSTSPEYLGIHNYYHESTIIYPIASEAAAYKAFVLSNIKHDNKILSLYNNI